MVYLAKRSRIRGMTLIELLIGLFIIIIGMTVAVPSYQGLINRNQVVTEVNEFLLAINFARTEAGRSGGTVSIQSIGGGGSSDEFGGGYCVTEGNPGNCGTAIRVFQAVPAGMTLDSENDLSVIVFDALGGLQTPQVLTFDLCHPQVDGRRVIVTAIGRPKIHRDDDAVAGNRPTCP